MKHTPDIQSDSAYTNFRRRTLKAVERAFERTLMNESDYERLLDVADAKALEVSE